MAQIQQIGVAARSCSERRVLLHIGLPKTGTTSLQTLLFERHPDIRYLGQTNIWTDPEAKIVLRALLEGDPGAAEVARACISQLMHQDRTVVVSDEAITFGELMLRARKWRIDSTPETVAANIRSVLPDARVLIVLRNQSDWLVSWHRQGVKTGKYSETKFEKWLDRDLGKERRQRLFALLDYDRLVNAYTDQFGAEHVDVRFYENHCDDFPGLAVDIAKTHGFSELEAHDLVASSPAANITPSHFRSLPPEIHKLARTEAGQAVLDRMPERYRTILRELFVRNRPCETLEETTSQQIRAHFRSSNLALRERLGFYKVPNCYT